MLLIVADGNGVLQTIAVSAQEAVTDFSTTIVTAGIPQNVFGSVAQPTRSGWFFQNNGQNPMVLNVFGGTSTITVPVGGIISTKSNVPLTTGIITVTGNAGDAYTAYQW
jgi:hypothetical protein